MDTRQLRIAREGLSRLKQLDPQDWASQGHIFGEPREDWQRYMLDRLAVDGVVEVGFDRTINNMLYTLTRDPTQRMRGQEILSRLLDDEAAIKKLAAEPSLLDEEEVPTGVRGNPIELALRPARLPQNTGQVVLTLPLPMYERFSRAAEALEQPIEEYILDQLRGDI